MQLTRFPKPERLTARLAVGITVFVIVPLAAGLYLLARHQYQPTIAARRAAGELEHRILEAALRHQMIRKDGRLMTEILREVGRQPEVRRAMVLDHDGVIRMSSREPDVGVRIPRASPTCLVCPPDRPCKKSASHPSSSIKPMPNCNASANLDWRDCSTGSAKPTWP